MRGLNLSFRPQLDRLSHQPARVPSPLIDEAGDLAHALSVTNTVLAAIRTRYRAMPTAADPCLWCRGGHRLIELQARQQDALGWIAAQVAVVYLHITAHTCRKEKRAWSKGTSKGSYAVIEWERSALDLAPGSSCC